MCRAFISLNTMQNGAPSDMYILLKFWYGNYLYFTYV